MNTMKIEASQKEGNLKIQGMRTISILNTQRCLHAKEYNLILYMKYGTAQSQRRTRSKFYLAQTASLDGGLVRRVSSTRLDA